LGDQLNFISIEDEIKKAEKEIERQNKKNNKNI
jgi:hypothetical protein